MQQTTTYKLNKPENTDTFSVSPLNENADTLEAQLARLDGADAAETAARTAETAALDQRVTLLEAKKMAAGSYKGTGGTQFIDLGFTPIAVFAYFNATHCGLVTQTAYGPGMKIVENGFTTSSTSPSQMNYSGWIYGYIAFG